MSPNIQANHISKKRVVYTMPGVDAVKVRRDEVYRVTDAGALTMDLYSSGDSMSGVRRPAVILVTGFADAGAEKMLGCTFKETGSYVSWAELMAASGLVAITYTNHDPGTDVHALLQYVRQNAPSLDIDENRIGLWACSGHVPNALSVLMQNPHDHLKCAVLCYGYMFDRDGSTGVAEAARQWGFVNPGAGKSVDDLAPDIPLFVARAGRDQMPGLNEALDDFLTKAVTRNLPLTFVNHAAAPHAFDLFDDSESARDIIKRILAFLEFHLQRR